MKALIFLLPFGCIADGYVALQNGQPIEGWVVAVLISIALFLKY